MSGAVASAGTSRFSAFVNHPAGPKTVYFWAPFMKWGLVAAGLQYRNRPTDEESIVYQKNALAASGTIWVNYSFVITPFNITKNYGLAAVNFFGGATGQLKTEASKIQLPTNLNLMSYLPSFKYQQKSKVKGDKETIFSKFSMNWK